MTADSRAGIGYPRAAAFTLIELLVVIAIMALMTALAVPLFNTIAGSQGLDAATGELEHLLEQARSYAMGKNTYVYVGIEEIDAAQQGPGPSQTATAGVGRLVVGIVSSQDGSSGYDSNASGNPIWSNYNDGADLSAVSRVQTFSNVHLADLSSSMNGGMQRPSVTVGYNLGNNSCQSVTPVAWPPGRSLNSGQYNFTKVIQFDPQGSARVIVAGNGSALPQWIEIGLQPTHGNALPASLTQGNQAALQINGVNGAVRIYRP